MTERIARLRQAVRHIAAVVRQVVGAPDYQRYVAHVRACHPNAVPAGPDEFYRARLEERYNKPGAKCC
jgi:uncharacterized short protein YbdD (DUF466 family)